MDGQRNQDLLTEKQRMVVEQVALRKPIKLIAADLGIAPSTVNEHIRAAKRRLNANTLSELVERWLELRDDTPSNDTGANDRVEQSRDLSNSVERDDATPSGQIEEQVHPAPHKMIGEPRVVPEELDGSSAIVPRLIAIAKITGGLLAAFVLAITSFEAISKLLT